MVSGTKTFINATAQICFVTADSERTNAMTINSGTVVVRLTTTSSMPCPAQMLHNALAQFSRHCSL